MENKFVYLVYVTNTQMHDIIYVGTDYEETISAVSKALGFSDNEFEVSYLRDNMFTTINDTDIEIEKKECNKILFNYNIYNDYSSNDFL